MEERKKKNNESKQCARKFDEKNKNESINDNNNGAEANHKLS